MTSPEARPRLISLTLKGTVLWGPSVSQFGPLQSCGQIPTPGLDPPGLELLSPGVSDPVPMLCRVSRTQKPPDNRAESGAAKTVIDVQSQPISAQRPVPNTNPCCSQRVPENEHVNLPELRGIPDLTTADWLRPFRRACSAPTESRAGHRAREWVPKRPHSWTNEGKRS